jgi:hypothetical protein
MYEFIIATIISLQSIAIIVGSIVVLQKVLHKCSAGLRLAFVIFPIGASLEILDVLSLKEHHISSVVLNGAIILTIMWLWMQRVLIAELEEMINKDGFNPCKYSFIKELKVIISCFAVWVLRLLNQDSASRESVSNKIIL